jgi:hypothetical protein
VTEIGVHCQVDPTRVTLWRSQLLQNASVILGGTAVADLDQEQMNELHMKIGQSTTERGQWRAEHRGFCAAETIADATP